MDETTYPFDICRSKVQIRHITRHAAEAVERAGRVCYRSEENITRGSAEKFIRMLIKKGHDSVLEHAYASFFITTDRGVSHELVRHRLASYSQESTRYCDYNKSRLQFVLPPISDKLEIAYNPEGTMSTVRWKEGEMPTENEERALGSWLGAMASVSIAYKQMRKGGCSPQTARSVLPNSLQTNVVMTANLREWRHMLQLRTAPAAHPQMREVALLILDHLKCYVPVFVEDICPEEDEAASNPVRV